MARNYTTTKLWLVGHKDVKCEFQRELFTSLFSTGLSERFSVINNTVLRYSSFQISTQTSAILIEFLVVVLRHFDQILCRSISLVTRIMWLASKFMSIYYCIV
jgi:hypothetical protein